MHSTLTPTNKVCFLVALGYFKASNRFTARQFYDADVAYVAKKLDIPLKNIEVSEYDKESYQRHKRLILDFLGFQEFDAQARKSIAIEISTMVRSQKRPKLILVNVLEILIHQKIAIPPYNTLYTLIINQLQEHKQELILVIENQLPKSLQKLLDELLEQGENKSQNLQRYKLTLLKRFSQSTRPSKIKNTVSDVSTLGSLYSKLESTVEALNLSHEGLRYYAQIVIKTKIFQLIRKSSEDRYLHLIAFVAHQFFKGQDILVDILLSVTQNAINIAQRERKEKYFQDRLERKRSVKRLLGTVEKGITNPLEKIESIAFTKDCPDEEKVKLIQKIFLETKDNRGIANEEIDQFEQATNKITKNADYYDALEERSLRLQNRASDILKALPFKGENTNLLDAVKHYQQKNGNISYTAPITFLEEEEQDSLIDAEGKFRVSLYKALLFIKVAAALKSRGLHLEHSYKYRSLDDYLISKEKWQKNKQNYLQRAGLTKFADPAYITEQLGKELDEQYHQTNQQILEDKNPHIKFFKDGKFHVSTPKIPEYEGESLFSFFPQGHYISLLEVLHTVNKQSKFLDAFEHWQHKYARSKPANTTFFAGIIGYGCNIGLKKIAKISRHINESELENTINWYFSLENIHAANDKVLALMSKMALPSIYLSNSEGIHTSSDGQKFEVSVDSLNAHYSYKYFGQAKGVSSINFIDGRHFLWHSNLVSSAEREMAYVIDGLMHNDVVKSDIHSTDTHGYTEVVSAVTHLLGFNFAPRLKNLKKRTLYSFKKRKDYEELGYKILPGGYINSKLIAQDLDDILRFVATIKLGEATASQLFRRLNSYSHQHPLYKALREFGRITKSIFILRYVFDVSFRQAIEKQLNKGESSNKFSKAVSFGNNQEFPYGKKEEQEVADNCRRLIKNTIICWNYLYLSQKIVETKDPIKRNLIIESIRNGSIATWQHLNLHGEYDFSEENLLDSIGFLTPRILTLDDLDLLEVGNL